MCGRFTLHLSELADLKALLGVQRVLITDWQPRYNIAPTQLAPAIMASPEGRTLRSLRWGLVPPWAEGLAEGNRRINARVEGVATAPSFRDALKRRRCVVPTTGFFEWRAVAGQRTKQPYWLRPDDGQVLALAGLWSTWVSRDGEVVDSFAIVTTEAHGVVREIHDRMPLSLHGPDVEVWLAEGALAAGTLEQIVARSAAHDAKHLIAGAVDRRVSSAAIDDVSCIQPPSEGAEHSVSQLSLFSERPPGSPGMDGERER